MNRQIELEWKRTQRFLNKCLHYVIDLYLILPSTICIVVLYMHFLADSMQVLSEKSKYIFSKYHLYFFICEFNIPIKLIILLCKYFLSSVRVINISFFKFIS